MDTFAERNLVEMVLRIFKAVWFMSLLVVLAAFMYIYASLPENVLFGDEETGVNLSRDGTFYLILVLIGIFNAMVFVFNRLSRGKESFLTWFFGLIATLNFLFVVQLYIINLFNSDERFDYGRLGFAIYGSVGLVIVWTIAWPIILIARKFLVAKELS